MKLYNLIIIQMFIVLIVSCGPNAEEKAAKEKAKMDSVIKTTEEATKHKIESIKLLEDSVKLAVSYKGILENVLPLKKVILRLHKIK